MEIHPAWVPDQSFRRPKLSDELCIVLAPIQPPFSLAGILSVFEWVRERMLFNGLFTILILKYSEVDTL